MMTRDATHPRFRLVWLALTAILAFGWLTGISRADVPTTVEGIEALKEQIEARSDLDEAVEQQILSLYDDALRWMQEAQTWRERALQFQLARDAAADEREQVQRELAQPMDTTITIPPDATLEAIRQLRDQAEADLNAARERMVELQRERDQRAVRRAEIPIELAAARSELEDVAPAVEAARAAGPMTDQARAMLAERAAREQKLQARIEALTKELANYDARRDLLPLRLERADRRIQARESRLRQWREQIDVHAKREAEQQVRAARRALADAHPVVREVAEKIVELLERRTGEDGVLAQISRYRNWAERGETRLLDLMFQYERDRQRIEAATRMGMIDVRLRHQREELVESRRRFSGFHRTARIRMATAQRERIDLEFERRGLPSVSVQRDALLDQLGDDIDDATRAEVAAELDRQLVELRTQYDELIDAYATFEQHLMEIDRALTPLLRLMKEYQRLIDERILWIRSMEPVAPADATVAWRALAAMFDPGAWQSLGEEQWREVRERPYIPGLAALIFSIWYVRRTRRTKRLRELAEQVRSYRTDQFQHTAEATLYTIVNSLFWPALVWVIAWQFSRSETPSDLAQQVTAGLNRVAWILLIFTFTLQFARNSGLAKAHFRWRDDTRNMLRWNLRWLGFVILPLSFIMSASEWEMLRSGNDPLGRFAFIAAMIVLTIFIAIVLRPHKGVLRHMLEETHSPWIERLSYFWYLAAMLIPLTLAGLAVGGYLYTALQLENHLIGTFALIIALVLINELVLRWLYIVQRRLAVAEARRKREEAQQQEEQRERERQAAQDAGEGEGEGVASTATPSPKQVIGAEGGAITIDETKLDLESVNSQARKLLRTGIVTAFLIGVWVIWSNMLPAIAMLDRVEVWPNFGNIREAAVATPPVETLVGPEWAAVVPRAQIPPPFAEPQRPFDAGDMAQLAGDPAYGVITLTNVLICIIIVIVAYLIGRNIPGLLEITILQRLPLQDSSRYAVVTLTRYVVIILGTILAFGAIGIGWTQVQWLVAAITLGLGFGLQEIVANFVSGIIILFEQPIRVGDTVTVGNTSGTVTKIRMRATTIVDWDRKEMIIPNKTFITSDVINWTLNDPVLRLVIPVGIAYGSDTLKAEQTLMRVADEHPIVLKDPPPSVVFSEFGDSSLNFNLRIFIPHISELIKTRHEMHRAIDQAFREAGIEIAFPQRDIHVRTIRSALSLTQQEEPKKLPEEDREAGG